MNEKFPIFDYKNCMACGICVQACPFSCLDLLKTKLDKYNKAYPEIVRKENCTGCGLCAKSCPIYAIKL